MGDEGNLDFAAEPSQLLLDLGPMAVSLDLVGEGVLVHRYVLGLLLTAPPGAGDPLLGVDHHIREQALGGERRQRQQRRGRVAAGVGDELRLADRLAVQLGQAVGCAVEQIGLTVGPVPLLICRQVAEPEVGGEVDHLRPEPPQRGDHRRRGGVRVGDDRRVGLLDPFEVELGQGYRRPVAGVEPVEARPCVASACRQHQLELRVPPDQLGAERPGIAGGPGDQHSGRRVSVDRLYRVIHAASPRSPSAPPRSRRAVPRPPRR